MSVKLSINIGDVFNRWKVLEECRDVGRLKYKVECSCGKVKLVEASNLFSGKSRSCGCLHKEVVGRNSTKHGMCDSPTYKSWEMMIQRCNKKSNHFHKYKRDGIDVCDEWRKDFNNFLNDMGERPNGTSLDRKDFTKGYFKENCRWASLLVQSINKGVNSKNTSGFKGVSYDKRSKKWRAYLFLKGVALLDKKFSSKEEAISARRKAEDEYFRPLLEEETKDA